MKEKIIALLLGFVCLMIVVALGVKSYHAYTLKMAKDQCLKKVEAKVDISLYRTKEQNKIASCKKETIKKIKNETNKEKLNSYLDEYSNFAKSLKTDKDLDALEKKEKQKREAAKKKEEAKKKAEEKKKKEQQTTQNTYQNTNNTNSSNNSYSGGSNNSSGCVGNDAKNFY